MQYRAEIDGLRAVAIIPVVLFHAGVGVVPGGYIGVDVFFVLSGYLITSILSEDLAAQRFSLAKFYERRTRRILPALVLVVLVTWAAAALVLLPSAFEDLSSSVVSIAGFVSNIFFWKSTNYFDRSAELKPLLHTWSLAVEEQFYILFPLILAAVWRFGKAVLASMIALASIVSLVIAVIGTTRAPAATFYLLPTRAWELGLGALGALYAFNHHEIEARAKQAASFAGLALILGATFAYNQKTPFPGLAALAPTLGTLLVIRYATEGTVVQRILSWRPIVLAGLISYSAYLWHVPIFTLVRHASNQIEIPPVVASACIVATFGLAFLTWRFLENPCRFNRVWSRNQVLSAGGASLLCLGAIGVFGVQAEGWQSRLEKRILQGEVGHSAFFRHLAATSRVCDQPGVLDGALTYKGWTRCMQTRPGEPTIVLLGDSHVESLFPGLRDQLPHENVAYYQRDAIPYEGSAEFAPIFQALRGKAANPRVVLYSMYYSRREHDLGRLSREVDRVVKHLRQAGRTVILLGDVPAFEIDPEACFFRRIIDPAAMPTGCALSARDFQDQSETYRLALSDVARSNEVRYIDFSDVLCAELNARCSMVAQGRILYRDPHHLNVIGSAIVAQAIVARSPELLALQHPPRPPVEKSTDH